MSNKDGKESEYECDLCSKDLEEENVIVICKECLYDKKYHEFLNIMIALNKEIEKLKEENNQLKNKSVSV